MNRYEHVFQPVVGSTVTSFNSTLGSASVAYPIESTLRKWQGPGSRVVRTQGIGATVTTPYYVAFGSSLVSAVVGTAMLVSGGAIFKVGPSQSYIAFVSSTDVIVNVTPGYGA